MTRPIPITEAAKSNPGANPRQAQASNGPVGPEKFSPEAKDALRRMGYRVPEGRPKTRTKRKPVLGKVAEALVDRFDDFRVTYREIFGHDVIELRLTNLGGDNVSLIFKDDAGRVVQSVRGDLIPPVKKNAGTNSDDHGG